MLITLPRWVSMFTLQHREFCETTVMDVYHMVATEQKVGKFEVGRGRQARRKYSTCRARVRTAGN